MDETLLHRALGDRSRVRILRVLRASDRGLDVSALAAAVGLHENTIRSHLAVLENARLVTSELERRPGRGRPRALYASARRLDADASAAPLLELLDGLGFEPELAGDDDAPEVRMHRCPFGITPEAPAPQVCRAHLGIVGGALRELRAPFEIEGLEIFPVPTHCAVRLRRTGASGENP
jgi:predicted ArsR family transcriptional regulator